MPLANVRPLPLARSNARHPWVAARAVMLTPPSASRKEVETTPRSHAAAAVLSPLLAHDSMVRTHQIDRVAQTVEFCTFREFLGRCSGEHH